jgi:hypothetical protein
MRKVHDQTDHEVTTEGTYLARVYESSKTDKCVAANLIQFTLLHAEEAVTTRRLGTSVVRHVSQRQRRRRPSLSLPLQTLHFKFFVESNKTINMAEQGKYYEMYRNARYAMSRLVLNHARTCVLKWGKQHRRNTCRYARRSHQQSSY